MKIKNIKSREILDSRGNPTIETEITLTNNIKGIASVPSGASCGIFEALELRDNDDRYLGKGVEKAVRNVNEIIKNNIINKEFYNQKELDDLLIKLDGTNNKSNLGANAILSVSLAFSRCIALNENKYLYASLGEGKKLPTPFMNIINGGVHANNNLNIQEFMIVPIKNTSIKEKIRMSTEVFHNLKKVLIKNKIVFNGVGDEGGYAPMLNNDEDAIKLIIEAIELSNYKVREDFMIALDVASSEWYNKENDNYILIKNNKELTKEELIDYYEYLVNTYPILSIEDPLSEIDYEGWKLIYKRLNDKIMLVGDDLFVTNINKLNEGIKEKYANAILIKYNQIGTLSETIEVINKAKENNMKVIISHRSGETSDTFISHLAIAMNGDYIKAGAPSRTERVEKYNELIRIEENL